MQSPEGTRCARQLYEVPGVGRSRETGCLLPVAAGRVPTDSGDSGLMTVASWPKALPWWSCLQPGVYRFYLFAACRLWEPDTLLKCYPVSLLAQVDSVSAIGHSNPCGPCVCERAPVRQEVPTDLSPL